MAKSWCDDTLYSASVRATWVQRLGELTSRTTTRFGELSPRTILGIGFAAFIVYAFPGYMSTDSVQQLTEARTGVFSDAHPPLMAAIWWVLDRIVAGPVLMLLLQGAMFLGGLYVLLQRFLSPRASACVAASVLVFPPVLVVMAVIWKDSQMAAFLVAGTAALVHPNLRIRVVGLVLLALACALRHNAFAAVVPLVFFLFEWRTKLQWWRRILIGLAAAVLLVGAAFVVSRVIAVNHVPLTPIYKDIAGMVARMDDRSDAELAQLLRGTPLAVTENIQTRARHAHALVVAWKVVIGPDRFFDHARTPEQDEALRRVWRELVFSEPLAYVHSHWDSLAVLLGLCAQDIPGPIWNVFLEDQSRMIPIEHTAAWSGAQAWLGRALHWLHFNTYLFGPFMYAAIALALLVMCARDRLTIGLFTSGLLYELSFFPVGANPDYRYSHWMITSTVIATVVLYVVRSRRPA